MFDITTLAKYRYAFVYAIDVNKRKQSHLLILMHTFCCYDDQPGLFRYIVDCEGNETTSVVVDYCDLNLVVKDWQSTLAAAQVVFAHAHTRCFRL